MAGIFAVVIALLSVADGARADYLYVSVNSGDRIDRVDTATGATTTVVPSIFQPRGIAFTPDGSAFYVAHSIQSQSGYYEVRKYSAAGVDLGQFAATGFNSQPLGVAVDALGDVYVAVFGQVNKYAPTGTSLPSGINPADVSGPKQLAFDSVGRLLVTDGGGSNVRRFTAAGTPAGQTGMGSVFISGIASAGGLALDAADNVYVGDTFNFLIDKFDANGMNGTVFNSTTGARAYALAIDGGGNVFSMNPPNLYKFTPAGTQVGPGAFSSGFFAGSEFMTIQPVPEPGGVALVTGLIGWSTLRRRRRD
jgi:sugar lactone lactonase YvrE